MSLVLYEVEDSVGIITINRPEVLNALNSAVLDELRDVLRKVDINTVRCLIVTGAGDKSFVAGADIAEMKNLNSREAMEFSVKGNNVFESLAKFPIPVIAAVNGYALGGGCELCLSCDIRICSENAVFGQPETGLGITPGFGGTQRLIRMVGEGMAKQMIYTARNIKADEAYRIGLVNSVHPVGEVLNAAKKIAKQIAANAPIAVRASKEAIHRGRLLPIEGGKLVEERAFGICFETHDQQEGMGAFLEKRKEKKFTNN
ncbi:enoyl-CoA hydratase-related protein [[Clostridium] aminophilum]|uniref:enoyl-CoA hydratase-related protein n=1 Tax=[Clostridium] aminophilum TaxID=1526 RepID=UPI0033336302